mmetsp:Transcript_21390/g.63938  ORF Transcript_21390/g.63938 Transcript_21390/m.63938 type:complete len:768 (+) Transcript_21390:188-2491(+)
MAWTAVVDLISDDENDAPRNPATPAAASRSAPPKPRTTAGAVGILEAALARAGGSKFSGGVRPTAPRPQHQQLRQALYGGSMPQGWMHYAAVTLSVASPKTFKVNCETQLPPACLGVIQRTPGAVKKADAWELPLTQHINFCVAMQDARVMCERIPQKVLGALSAAANNDESFKAGNGFMDDEGFALGDEDAPDAISDIPRSIWRQLAPFQRYGVSWIVKNNGRCLIADEPGLGKTIQAIGGACAYYHEWPVLVVCPSSARFHWEDQFKDWLDDEDYLPRDSILTITSGKAVQDQRLLDYSKVLIVSYDLVSQPNVLQALHRLAPSVIVCDESHYLKNAKTARTRTLMPLLKASKRCILLSGTPALSRPNEIFSQLHALDDEAWPDAGEFSRRYCSGKKQVKRRNEDSDEDEPKKRQEYTAASNLEELHTLLAASVMLRRSKATILHQLPPKRRFARKVDVDDPVTRETLRADLEEFRERASELAQMSKQNKRRRAQPQAYQPPLDGGVDPREILREKAREKKALLMGLFRRTGPAKLPAIERRVRSLLSGDEEGFRGKVLIFAHHRAVLDGLARGALRHVRHIRIDGTTAARDRQARVNDFQKDAQIRVALLGITAAGVALTLTAASRVLFAELYWTPAALVQAEDRAHRIGQTSEVVVEYLLADGTVDEVLWPLVQEKMRLLGELFDNQKDTKLKAQEDKEDEDSLDGALLLDAELEELDKDDEEAFDVAKEDAAEPEAREVGYKKKASAGDEMIFSSVFGAGGL